MRGSLGFPLSCLLSILALGCSLPSIPGANSAKDVPAPRDAFEAPDNYVAGDGDAPGFALTGISPTRGPVAGGTRIEATGIGFEPGSTLVVGSTLAAAVVVQNGTSILATTPAHPAGWVDVVVQRPDGKTARLEGVFFFEATLSVASAEPAVGPEEGGTPITVRGAGFVAGSRLLVGGRQAQDVRVLDERTLLAVTPPGVPGPRDITIANESGSGNLRRGFRYAASPAVTRCDPPVAPDGDAFDVVVSGRGLDQGTLTVSTGMAQMVGAAADGEARLRFTPSGPGPVSVSFQGPGGTASRTACLWVESAADLSDPTPRVLSVTPSAGTAAGGDDATAIALGFEGAVPDALTVTVGGAAATQVSADSEGRAISFRTPAGTVGPADVVVRGPQGVATAPAAFRYLPDVALASVDPAFGPTEGGTLVRIDGVGLDQAREVFVGPLPAIIVAGPSATAIRVRTAPSSPGRQDVTVVTGSGRRVVLRGAFVFGATSPDLVAVTPDTGSWSGGTLVSIAGSDFVPGVVVRFGSGTATIVDSSDPARLKVLSPRSETADRFDVEVLWPDGSSRTLKQAFGYFDPTGYFGGVWGDPVNGSVNVTVLDSYTNLPVADAFAILGWESATPFKGRTDNRGQITLSAEDLFGPIQATVSREDYSTSSLVGVDAENLTLHIDPMNPTSSGGGGGGATTLVPGMVSGTVAGADKYLLAPPDSCADRQLVHGSLCAPCSLDADCGPGGACTSVAGGGFHCSTSCAAQADCPEGYACYSLGNGHAGCLPGPGRPEVQCGTSVTSLFSTVKSTGPGSIADSKGLYAVSARVGEVAIYCVGGLRRFDDGTFVPVAMGIRRHVPVNSARVTDSIDLDLSIPLDRDVDIRLVNAPGGPDGPNDHQVLVALDLGSDGALRLWPDISAVDGERFVLSHLPRDFTGDLADAVLFVHSEANSRTSDTIPYSTSVIPDWKPGQNLGVVEVTAKTARLLDPDERPDATGGCGLAGGGGLILGRGGRAWTLTPDGAVQGRPSLGRATFRACSARGDVALAVGDGGAVVRSGLDGTVIEPAPGVRGPSRCRVARRRLRLGCGGRHAAAPERPGCVVEGRLRLPGASVRPRRPAGRNGLGRRGEGPRRSHLGRDRDPRCPPARPAGPVRGRHAGRPAPGGGGGRPGAAGGWIRGVHGAADHHQRRPANHPGTAGRISLRGRIPRDDPAAGSRGVGTRLAAFIRGRSDRAGPGGRRGRAGGGRRRGRRGTVPADRDIHPSADGPALARPGIHVHPQRPSRPVPHVHQHLRPEGRSGRLDHRGGGQPAVGPTPRPHGGQRTAAAWQPAPAGPSDRGRGHPDRADPHRRLQHERLRRGQPVLDDMAFVVGVHSAGQAIGMQAQSGTAAGG